MGLRTSTSSAQEAQQVGYLTSLQLPGLNANASVSGPSTTLEPLDVHFAKIGQYDTALREPAIEGKRVSYFDVDDACSVLLLNQRCGESANMI
jgi:hypothetical protein